MKNKKMIIVILTLLLLLTTTLTVTSTTFNITAPSSSDRFDTLMTRLIKLGKFPSLSTCIIHHDQVVWSQGYGHYDLTEHKPAATTTLYMVCSVSKTITGTALMQLYDQGLFNLDDDVNLYLPFSLRNPNYPEIPISFRMLLSHASSINSDPASFYWLNNTLTPPISWYPYPWIEEYIVPNGSYYVPEIWSTQYKPGDTAMYANANFVLVAYLVELLSGTPFHEYCQQHIFEPLDMKITSFNLSTVDINMVAIPYHYFLGKYLDITEFNWEGISAPEDIYYTMLHYPVGGLYTNVEELSHFLIAHMNGGVYNGTRILNQTTIEIMHTIQPPDLRYGLAWYYSETIYGRLFSGHEGDIPGYHALMFLQHPDHDIGVIYLVNGDRYSTKGGLISLVIRNLLFFKANHLIPTENQQLQDFELNRWAIQPQSDGKKNINFLITPLPNYSIKQ